MNTNNQLKIDQPWPEKDLEQVEACPYCGSRERILAYKDVQDWSFYCAPGKWTYWNCEQCRSLYLDPRPTKESVGDAYGNYYTHVASSKTSILKKLKKQIKEKFYQSRFGGVGSTGFLKLAMYPLRNKFPAPFWMEALDQLPSKGKLLDVGCGDGTVLEWATKLGWRTTGVEIDSAAVENARSKGLQVVEGTYEKLSEIQEKFDCVVCLHVIEHVHNPIDLLERLNNALVPGGVLMIATPNASSQVRAVFQESWRGIEAPRHLSIPDIEQLKLLLIRRGFGSIVQFSNVNLTGDESSRIQRRDTQISAIDRKCGQVKNHGFVTVADERDDIVQIVCRKPL